MRAYSDEELTRYVESGDPLDKAGAYAIQHDGFAPIDHLEDCYTNVMGLPMCHLYSALGSWCARSSEASTMAQAIAGLHHPLTCCPYAVAHSGCAWAKDILAQSHCVSLMILHALHG